MILFEVPANEQIRVCLRLEQLHKKASFFLSSSEEWQSRACVEAILDMLQLLDRPDLRNKLSQETTRILGNLKRLQKTPQIDTSKLSHTIAQIESVSKTLHSRNGKFAESLRQNEFMKTLSYHHGTPGGICEYNLPEFQYWLSSSMQERQQNLKNWLMSFSEILEISNLLLQLIRSSGTQKKVSAHNGFYQTQLDPQSPCQLIRVEVDESYQVFPSISLGRHGVSISYFTTDLCEKSYQSRESIDFLFTCCIF